ncbi:hypothetical protein E2C01_031503 [Portunus trituberculatus]|uniref:Uncharacterized protein n=1 Tax=Portunus trituberculatus TaxID=210409 RepID=A0A5B7F086_PORTR|nr:hypothetical protein [Portunus trituberculatus]
MDRLTSTAGGRTCAAYTRLKGRRRAFTGGTAMKKAILRFSHNLQPCSSKEHCSHSDSYILYGMRVFRSAADGQRTPITAWRALGEGQPGTCVDLSLDQKSQTQLKSCVSVSSGDPQQPRLTSLEG